jgi:transcriptional regulator with XRE-family HTH domain
MITVIMNISENLKKLRESQGLSYRRLGAKVDISHNNLSQHEKTEMNLSLNNAIKICKYFEVPIEYLILGEKADFKYKDLTLLELFTKADDLDKEYRSMIKKYIRKIIKNAEEKQKLKEEAEG